MALGELGVPLICWAPGRVTTRRSWQSSQREAARDQIVPERPTRAPGRTHEL